MKLLFNPVFIIILLLILYNSFKTDLIKVQSINNKYYYTQKVKSLEASKILIILEEFANKLSYYVIKENPDNLYIKNKLKKKILLLKKFQVNIVNLYHIYKINILYIYVCVKINIHLKIILMNYIIYLCMK